MAKLWAHVTDPPPMPRRRPAGPRRGLRRRRRPRDREGPRRALRDRRRARRRPCSAADRRPGAAGAPPTRPRSRRTPATATRSPSRAAISPAPAALPARRRASAPRDAAASPAAAAAGRSAADAGARRAGRARRPSRCAVAAAAGRRRGHAATPLPPVARRALGADRADRVLLAARVAIAVAVVVLGSVGLVRRRTTAKRRARRRPSAAGRCRSTATSRRCPTNHVDGDRRRQGPAQRHASRR